MTAAKELFLASTFGGDVFRWKRQHQVVGSVDNLVIRTSLGTFPVGKFCSALRGAASEFGYAKPRLLELVRACGKDEGSRGAFGEGMGKPWGQTRGKPRRSRHWGVCFELVAVDDEPSDALLEPLLVLGYAPEQF